MSSTSSLDAVLNITPFPLVSWYGSAVRPIEQLRLLYKIENLSLNTIASYISQDVREYISPNKVLVLNSSLMPRLFRMGFNPNRFIHDSIFIKHLTDLFLSNQNIEKLYIHLSFTKNYIDFIQKIFYKRRIPSIIDVHGITTYSAENRLVKSFLNIIESSAFKNSTIVVSNASIREYLKRNFYVKDSFILPDVIDVNYIEEVIKSFGDHVEKIRKYLNATSKDFIIGYAGSINFIQGSDILVKSIKLLLNQYDNVKFLIIGSSFSNLQSFFQSLKLTLSPSEMKRILVLPNIPYFILPGYLSISNILITPKRYNFESNQKLLLYAAIGKPVVGFNTYANRFLVTEFNLKGVFLAKSISTEAFTAEIMNLVEELNDFQNDEYNYGSTNRDSIKRASIKIIENLKNLLFN
jgi:glycosyltransferase involved in cell wall biosynthesis